MPDLPLRPLIGITAYRQQTRWWAWDRDAALVPGAYLDVVTAAGGWPVLLPPTTATDPEVGGPGPVGPEDFARMVRSLDGVVVIGGGDIDARRFGQEPDARNGGTSAQRDDLEFGLLAAAIEADLPVLAVCRGLQVLNVLLGGTLVQQLVDAVGSTVHQPRAGAFGNVTVTTEPGSRTAELLGPVVSVRCCHHQAVDRLGERLVVTGRSDDGVIEAVELTGPRFVVGVQWHPEETSDTRLFSALVDAALERRAPIVEPEVR